MKTYKQRDKLIDHLIKQADPETMKLLSNFFLEEQHNNYETIKSNSDRLTKTSKILEVETCPFRALIIN